MLGTQKPMGTAPAHERGAALLLVSFILILVLVGGLAAIAVTSGELSSSRGYRTRQVTEACAGAGLEKVRAMLPVKQTEGTIHNLTYWTGHYGTGIADSVELVPSDSFDSSATSEGENITNALSLLREKVIIKTTTTCSGPGHGEREMELLFMCAVKEACVE